jgi:nucleoside phosphorylase/tetratricopeptide (TPR) repeat protein
MHFTNRTDEINAFASILGAKQTKPNLLVIEGPVGIGKTSLLRKFHEIAKEHAIAASRVDVAHIPLLKMVYDVVHQLNSFSNTKSKTSQFKRRHSSLFQMNRSTAESHPSQYGERHVLAEFVDLIRRICSEEKLILIFDGVHDWSGSVFAKWLMGELLSSAEIANLTVIAGTNSYKGGTRRISPVMLKVLLLEPLSPQHATELVVSFGVRDPQVASAIVDRSQGLPLKLEMLASTHLETGELTSEIDNECELANLIETRKESDELNAIRPLLDAAAVLRSFDEEMLLSLSHFTGKSALERLDQTFKIRQLGLGRYALHDAVRMAFNSQLATNKPGYYRQLHMAAFRLLQERIDWTTVASAEWYSLVKEAIYHRSLVSEAKFPSEIIFHLDHCCSIYSYRFLLECLEDLARNTKSKHSQWLEFYTAAANKNLYGSNKCEGLLNALCETVSTPPAIRTRAMNLLCEIQGESKGDWLSALQLAESSIGVGIVETKARSYELAGRACLALNKPFEARDHLEKAIVEYDKRGDSRGSGLAWNFLGCASSMLGMWREAEESFLKASKCFEESGYIYGFCTVARDRGISLLEMGEFDKAEAEMLLSAKLADDLDAPIASLLVSIKLKELMIRRFTLDISKGVHVDLIDHLSDELTQMRNLGFHLFEAIGIAAIAELYFILRRKDKLEECLGRINNLKLTDPSLAPYFFALKCFHSALVHLEEQEKGFWDSFIPDHGFNARLPPLVLRKGLFAISSYFYQRVQNTELVPDFLPFRENFLGNIPGFLTHLKPLLASSLPKTRPASYDPLRIWTDLTDSLVSNSRDDFMKKDAYPISDDETGVLSSKTAQATMFKGDALSFPVQTIEASKLKSSIRLAILVATQVELRAVLSAMKPLPRRSRILKVAKDNETFYAGKIGAVNAVVSLCSAGSNGPSGATLTANSTIEKWSPDAVLICGIAFGASRRKQREGDVLVATGIIPYENKRMGAKAVYRTSLASCGPKLLNRFRNVIGWDFRRADNSRVEVHFGQILSGEKLVDDPEFKTSLLNDFSEAIGGEMEGTGLWAAATRHNKEWIVVKSVCDWADGSKNDQFHELAARSSISLCQFVFSSRGALDGF